MHFRRFSVPTAVFLAALAASSAAEAQNKAAGRPKPAKQVKPAAKPAAAAAKPAAAKPKKAGKAEPEKADDDANAAGSAASDDAPKPTGEGESQVKAAGTSATQDASGSKAGAAKKDAVTQQEDTEGVKTYHFGAIEVESRLKSPQLIYFLRRVRAEFDAGALGHRSFLGELADTRNDSAFR